MGDAGGIVERLVFFFSARKESEWKGAQMMERGNRERER